MASIAGRLVVLKLPSTRQDPGRAVLAGLQQLGIADARLHYGTTVATNAVLERHGARVALVTTEGFEDVLEIARQVRPVLYALEPDRPPPLVPRARRFGVRERTLASGQIETALRAGEVARVVSRVRRSGARAVAVCLLHAYANPRHERRLGRALRRAGLHVTLSHELLCEYREYERTVTTVANAFVGPVMTGHLRKLGRAGRRGLWVMQSNGGLIDAPTAGAEPVRTVLSGPAGGVIGAAARAADSGWRRIITLDMGGTSTDVSFVDGVPATREETLVAQLPLRVPALDIHTVGAGGGSLVRIDEGGALRVGPESAGAEPGPACYGRGSLPTVTDAQLVLGRLVEGELLGGRLRVDRNRARAALQPIARRLGWSLLRTAEGVVSVATATMERAVRAITIERGLDPRSAVLVAFGGAGGLHAADLARSLGIGRVLVPRFPGLLSAWGALTSGVVRDVSRTVRLAAPDDVGLASTLRPLIADARALLCEEAGPLTIETSVDVRYEGQGFEITVPAGRGWRQRFVSAHRRLFGHGEAERRLEVVTSRVRARGPRVPPPRDVVPRRAVVRAFDVEPVVFAGRSARTAFFRREGLGVGARLRGPAIVCEYSATTVIPPGWKACVDGQGALLLEDGHV